MTRALRHTGRRVMLVPTMGALHDGHLALVRAAKRVPGAVVVVSIFVNPLQFGAGEDLDAYPRTLDDDLELLRAEGVEIVFTPTAAEMYPDGPRTSVQPGPLGAELEGAARPTHFAGVLTVVLKLLQIVAAGSGVLRREGLPAAGADPPDGRRPQRRHARSSACRSCANPTGWRCRRATATSTTVEREQAGALSAALLAGMYAASGGCGRRAGRRAGGARRGACDRRRLPARCATRCWARRPPRASARLLVAARLGTHQTARQHRDRHRSNRRHRRATTRRVGRESRIAMEELMLRTMLKSKIHRATVTQADLHYVGSVTIDADLMDAADLLEGEQVTIVDVDNGARLVTYAITGERGSGVIGINGAAAHLVHPATSSS